MEQNKLDRINELARKSKSIGLTDEEKEEQAVLRKEYVQLVHNNLRGQLQNISILNEDGSVTHLKDKGKN
ncbi:MAG: DUF896 domain-containing protein [Lachnospiraceae bacterium]|nr:DUF896 domain-containing protein [Lachnospiraceae bacterium]MBQ4068989.1 DUF896 domain-containing protein [Lachnospiraceae bacterium]